MTSPKRIARIAGFLYLLVAVFGTFAILFVQGKVYVPGDAATTAANLVSNSGLVRIGIVADLFQATVFVFLGMTLYVLLKHVDKDAARAMVVLVAIATAIICLNDVFQFASLRVATEASYADALGAKGANALVLLFMAVQHDGFLIAQIFFGSWLVPLGYLAFRSAMFPRALGVVLVVGGVCYLVEVLAMFLAPDLGAKISSFVVIPSAVAEFWMLGYLLAIGVRTQKPEERALAAA